MATTLVGVVLAVGRGGAFVDGPRELLRIDGVLLALGVGVLALIAAAQPHGGAAMAAPGGREGRVEPKARRKEL